MVGGMKVIIKYTRCYHSVFVSLKTTAKELVGAAFLRDGEIINPENNMTYSPL